MGFEKCKLTLLSGSPHFFRLFFLKSTKILLLTFQEFRLQGHVIIFVTVAIIDVFFACIVVAVAATVVVVVVVVVVAAAVVVVVVVVVAVVVVCLHLMQMKFC